ncbi:anti-sigma factor family protein [Nocardia miyunensis]|uniref:anti-sigma factor family protein n=1 Tax=Nocardia miyunensis TaxID=282684 RepID=UPI000A5227D7|nr:zf-HC2 domain-containing protein [Nocardia miyunensis]
MTDVPRIGEDEAVVPDGDDYVMWDAPYVLGSLSRAERLRYEAHLAECASCRDAVAELSGLPGLLGQVDPEVALALIDTPPAPKLIAVQQDQQQAEQPRAEPRGHRRDRWITIGAAVAAAAAAVVIAVPITIAIERHPEQPSTEQVVAERQLAPVLPSPVTASYKLVEVPGGTRIEMSCTYSPSETDYTWQGALWVQHADGTEAMVAQWTAHPGQTLTPDGTTAVPPDQIRSVQIRDAITNQVILSSSL